MSKSGTLPQSKLIFLISNVIYIQRLFYIYYLFNHFPPCLQKTLKDNIFQSFLHLALFFYQNSFILNFEPLLLIVGSLLRKNVILFYNKLELLFSANILFLKFLTKLKKTKCEFIEFLQESCKLVQSFKADVFFSYAVYPSISPFFCFH